jgi:hypothetical protein
MAADTQDRLPIFDYDVISEGGPKNREPGEKPKPGDRWEESVFNENPPVGSWRHGDTIVGTVEIHAKGPEEDPRFDAAFTFTAPPCSIRVDDEKVPGGKDWKGKRTVKARGEGREADVEIEFRNPKRW